VFVYLFVRIYVCARVYACVFVYVCVRVYAFMYVFVCVTISLVLGDQRGRRRFEMRVLVRRMLIALVLVMV